SVGASRSEGRVVLGGLLWRRPLGGPRPAAGGSGAGASISPRRRSAASSRCARWGKSARRPGRVSDRIREDPAPAAAAAAQRWRRSARAGRPARHRSFIVWPSAVGPGRRGLLPRRPGFWFPAEGIVTRTAVQVEGKSALIWRSCPATLGAAV